MKWRFPRIKLGIFTTLFLIFTIAAIIIFTPAGVIIVRLIPNNVHEALFKNIYQQKTLIKNPGTLEKELTLTNTLPVLGTQTGVCFEFEAGGLTVGQKNKAEKGKIIADVIAMGPQQQQYELRYVDITKTKDKTTVICQQFGRFYSSTADSVIMLTIKPKQQFTPIRIFWVSTIDIFKTNPPTARTTP